MPRLVHGPVLPERLGRHGGTAEKGVAGADRGDARPDVAEEALSLLEYTEPPYEILRARLDDVLPQQRPYARYLLSLGE
ncbi:MAG: hypothetical protein IJM64_03595 [Ottowia sp.]|nr:hypothetical protein [Ottowia sp.]